MSAVVYVIRTDSGEVKVGFSGTPYARLSSIKREYGARRGFRDAQMVGFVSTPHFLVVESMAIHRLLPHATSGEWFRCDPYAALDVVLEEARFWDPEAEITWPSSRVRWRVPA